MFKDNYKVDQQYNESKNSHTYSQDPINVPPHIIDVSNTENKGKNKHWRGYLDQTNNKIAGGKQDCNNNDLKIIKQYLDSDSSDFNREYWDLIESGVDDKMNIWSYKIDKRTNPVTIPWIKSVYTDKNMSHTLTQNTMIESVEEISGSNLL